MSQIFQTVLQVLDHLIEPTFVTLSRHLKLCASHQERLVLEELSATINRDNVQDMLTLKYGRSRLALENGLAARAQLQECRSVPDAAVLVDAFLRKFASLQTTLRLRVLRQLSDKLRS